MRAAADGNVDIHAKATCDSFIVVNFNDTELSILRYVWDGESWILEAKPRKWLFKGQKRDDPIA